MRKTGPEIVVPHVQSELYVRGKVRELSRTSERV